MIKPHVTSYVDELTRSVTGIDSVWLFGSRANNTFRSNSDWDLIAFANSDAYNQLESLSHLKRPDFDLLVVVDKESFREPWPDSEGTCKGGDFTSWDWKVTNDSLANYRSVKYRSEEWFKNGQADIKTLTAIRIWP
jgi:predicted nucleotidyltransferase